MVCRRVSDTCLRLCHLPMGSHSHKGTALLKPDIQTLKEWGNWVLVLKKLNLKIRAVLNLDTAPCS